jgi:Cu(I)/Ag(I) efflux system periplasmic protein CusF
MKKARQILFAATLGAAAVFMLPVHAQSDHHGHAAAPAAKSPSGEGEGEVRKVDKEGKKITLKHGPIKNLDMPAMTMVFLAADPSLVDKVKVGDKVRFVATNPGGKLTVTDIQPVK